MIVGQMHEDTGDDDELHHHEDRQQHDQQLVGHVVDGLEVREDLDKQSEAIIAGMEVSSEAIYTSARMLDDGLIDPRDTRHVVSFCLTTVKETPHRDTEPNSFGVMRL